MVKETGQEQQESAVFSVSETEPSIQLTGRTGYWSLDLVPWRLLVHFTREVSVEYWG